MTDEADRNLRIDVPIQIDRAASLEALTQLLAHEVEKAAKEGRRIISVSHEVDRDDPEGKPYSYVLVTETRFPEEA